MSRNWLIFSAFSALPLICGVSCSDRTSEPSALSEDAGSAGTTEPVPEHDSGLRNTDCTKLTVGQCAAGTQCQVLEAQLRAPRCASEFEAVGCVAGETVCSAVETRAQDPKGRAWLFLSSCIPFGWKELPPATPDACGMGVAGATN